MQFRMSPTIGVTQRVAQTSSISLVFETVDVDDRLKLPLDVRNTKGAVRYTALEATPDGVLVGFEFEEMVLGDAVVGPEAVLGMGLDAAELGELDNALRQELARAEGVIQKVRGSYIQREDGAVVGLKVDAPQVRHVPNMAEQRVLKSVQEALSRPAPVPPNGTEVGGVWTTRVPSADGMPCVRRYTLAAVVSRDSGDELLIEYEDEPDGDMRATMIDKIGEVEDFEVSSIGMQSRGLFRISMGLPGPLVSENSARVEFAGAIYGSPAQISISVSSGCTSDDPVMFS